MNCKSSVKALCKAKKTFSSNKFNGRNQSKLAWTISSYIFKSMESLLLDNTPMLKMDQLMPKLFITNSQE